MSTYHSLPWHADGDAGVDSNCHKQGAEAGTEYTHGRTTGVREDRTTASDSMFLSASGKESDDTTPVLTTIKPIGHEGDLMKKGTKNRFWSRASALNTDSWTPEVVGLLVSWASLIGAASLFHHLDDIKSVSDWTLRLSPSTLVAILARAAQIGLAIPIASCVGQLGWIHFVKRKRKEKRSKKLCVLPSARRERTVSDRRRLIDLDRFYNASRGPLGAMSLLFTVPNAASLLCFTTILVSLGFEAALQQCLSVNNPRYIPRVYDLTAVDPPSGTDGFTHFGSDVLSDTIGLTMGAVYSLQNDTPIFKPSTNDYTLKRKGTVSPVYTTLSFCPSCDPINLQPTSDGGGSISLPDGSVASIDSGTLMRLIPLTVQQNNSQSWQGPLTLADFVVVGQFDLLPGTISSDSTGNVDAQRCQIDLCVQLYQQTFLDYSSSNVENPLWSFEHTVRRPQSDDYNAGWVISPPARMDLSTTAAFPSAELLGPKQAVWISDGSSYSIDDGVYDFMSKFFYSLFDGVTETTEPQTDSFAQTPIEPVFLQALITTDQNAVAASGAAQFIETLNTACKGMEVYIRDNYPTHSLEDRLNIPVSTYGIRWAWVALPAAVEVLATVLLVVVIVGSTRVNLPLWKTGILPILLRSAIQVDYEEWEAGNGAKPSILEEKAVGMYAELRSTDSGYLLEEV